MLVGTADRWAGGGGGDSLPALCGAHLFVA